MQTTRGASLIIQNDAAGRTADAAGAPPAGPRRIGVLITVAVLALAADIVSKIIVVANLQDREPIELLGGLLTLRETRNSGAAFSIGTGMTIVFTLIAVGVVIAILRTARNLRSLPWALSLGLLLGGALGNLGDRLFRSPAPLKGHVVDWIELPYWPVFNLADSAIVCGGILAVLLAARGLQPDGTRVPDQDTASPAKPVSPAKPAPPAEAGAVGEGRADGDAPAGESTGGGIPAGGSTGEGVPAGGSTGGGVPAEGSTSKGITGKGETS